MKFDDNIIDDWKAKEMKKFKHDFIHAYDGLGAFGMDRNYDEETLMYTFVKKFWRYFHEITYP